MSPIFPGCMAMRVYFHDAVLCMSLDTGEYGLFRREQEEKATVNYFTFSVWNRESMERNYCSSSL